MKKLLTILTLMLPSLAFGQWRVGVNGGADYNHFIIDKHYQTDYVFEDRWGVTLGVMGQYDINSWLGIRAELDWTQKNSGHIGVEGITPVYVYLPTECIFDFNKQLLEGVGVTPDIEVAYDPVLFKNTKQDSQIDRALQFIRTGN